MTWEVEQALVEKTLERSANQLGDITRPVFDLFYARWPNARAQFKLHDQNKPERLEGEMVEQAVYCLMRWYERPGEIEIILVTTIPHHIESLGISAEDFTNLFEAVFDTIGGTIPSTALDEMALWQNLRDTMLKLCAIGVSYSRPELVRRLV